MTEIINIWSYEKESLILLHILGVIFFWLFLKLIHEKTGLQHPGEKTSDQPEKKENNLKSGLQNQALLEAVPDMIIWVNRDGVMLYIKASANYPTILPLEEYYEKNISEYLQPELAFKVLKSIELAVSSGEIQTVEYDVDIAGVTFYREARIVRCGEDEAIIVIRDFTESRKASQKITEAGESLLKSQQLAAMAIMSASITHEINQPLNAIKMTTSSLLYLYRKGRKCRISSVMQDVKTVLKQLEYIENIIKNNRFSTFDDPAPAVGPVCLNTAVEEAIQLCSSSLSLYRVYIEKNLCPCLPPVLGNRGHFIQVLVNLLDNAVQSLISLSKSEKVVLLSTQAKGGSVLLEVSDNGPGIRDEIKDDIFKPFFTTKVGRGNTGMGLAIVNYLVKKYNGKISVYKGPLGGASFCLEFPARPYGLFVTGVDKIEDSAGR